MGIDHSEVMVRQASQRNAEGLADGRVVLILGSVAMLTELRGSFDKIYSVNVFQFWDDPVSVFRSLQPLLRRGGVLATTYMPRHPGANNQDTMMEGERIAECLRAAGFQQVQSEFKQMQPVSVVCVLATQAGQINPTDALTPQAGRRTSQAQYTPACGWVARMSGYNKWRFINPC